MRRYLPALAVSSVVALGAIMALSRPAVASSGCSFHLTETCEVVNAGEICYELPSGPRCDPIIVAIPGVKNEV